LVRPPRRFDVLVAVFLCGFGVVELLRGSWLQATVSLLIGVGGGVVTWRRTTGARGRAASREREQRFKRTDGTGSSERYVQGLSQRLAVLAVSAAVVVACASAAYAVSAWWVLGALAAAPVVVLGAMALVRPPSVTISPDRLVGAGAFRHIGVRSIARRDLEAVGVVGDGLRQSLLLLVDGEMRRWGSMGVPATVVAAAISRIMGVPFIDDDRP
jgi:hypothetical protein